jgi:hypothetical protein
MVSKLYELAEMISHINVDEPPRPTPSKSDPLYHPPLRKKPSRGTMYPERQRYNKSADTYHPSYYYGEYYQPQYYYPQEQQRPRRKSFGEEPLRRKGSRGSMKRPTVRHRVSGEFQQPEYSEYPPEYYGQYYYGYPDTYYTR